MKRGGVVHIINSLGQGGAEVMMANLIEVTRNSSPTTLVIGLAHDGVIGEQIRASGVNVIALNIHRTTFPQTAARLTRLLRETKPDVVQTWMYHANLIGGLATKTAGAPPVAWGVHHADLSPESAKSATRAIAKASALFSHATPSKVVFCAEASKVVHERLGYAKKKSAVIPNGFDTTRFTPDPEAPARLKERIGAPAHARLVGLVARFHPVKDHRTFVQAAAIAAQSDADLHFVLCGKEVNWENEELAGWIRETGCASRFHLLGLDSEPWLVHAGLDVGCLSSTSEAFPLSVGESMACGVPCAVTDVGDASVMVAGSGRVAPSQNPAALAAALRELLDLDPAQRAAAGARARSKIEREYSLPAVAARYESVWRQIASAPR